MRCILVIITSLHRLIVHVSDAITLLSSQCPPPIGNALIPLDDFAMLNHWLYKKLYSQLAFLYSLHVYMLRIETKVFYSLVNLSNYDFSNYI